MQLTTPVDISTIAHYAYEDSFLLIGSCFTSNIARKMRQAYMQVCENPFGELYNPLSVAECLRWLQTGDTFTAGHLVSHDGLCHSMLHHGSFSMPDQQQTLDRINTELQNARLFVRNAKRLHIVITFGSAYVYQRLGQVVGNCHKLPADEFSVHRLSVGEIIDCWQPLISRWDNADFLFTVSPIRHKAYGMHGNQLGKAALLLAVEQLEVPYFPAYEIMLDELRDYRFYAADMLHPSETAVDYIWQRFTQSCFSLQAQQQIAEAETVNRLVNHRMLHPGTNRAQQYEQLKQQKINNLKQQYPWIENLLP